MKQNIFFFIFSLFVCSGIAQDRAQQLHTRLFDPTDRSIFVVSHRGDWRNAPENSLQAMLNCMEMGVDMIEIDLKMTRDSVLILMHDKTIDRTTTGKGRPEDYKWEELKKLKLRNGAGHATRHPIPTLEEVMLVSKGHILVNIDKGYDYFRQVYRILERTGTVNQCIIKASLPYSQVKAEHPDLLDKVIFMPVINLDDPGAKDRLCEYVKEMKPVAIEVVFNEQAKNVETALAYIQHSGSRIWINSLWPDLCGGHDDDRAVEQGEKEETWGWIVRSGATLIQTDRPAELIEWLHLDGSEKEKNTTAKDIYHDVE